MGLLSIANKEVFLQSDFSTCSHKGQQYDKGGRSRQMSILKFGRAKPPAILGLHRCFFRKPNGFVPNKRYNNC